MRIYLLIIATIFLTSCKSQSLKPDKSNFETGTLLGNVFSNAYFGIKIEVDSTWHILNKAELSHLMSERADMLNGGSGNQISITKGVDILLSITIDTLETMPHVLFSSLDLKLFPKIKNETDYLNDYFNQVKNMYKNYDVQITASEIGEEVIGKKKLTTLLITIKVENFLAYQKRYSIKIKDRLLNIMVNYNSDTHLKNCLNLLNNVKWE